jgi:hypothetical protein
MEEHRTVPYSAEVRAKGWRFELDHERIEQSDTWALAPPDLRPWLLMLWLTAWRQTPCGSLPSEDALIAARIGMPLDRFAQVRTILMRGWWLAGDGRLYHDTITQCVLAMLAAREKERNRKADWRGRGHAPVPRDNSGTTNVQPRDSIGGHTPVTAPVPEPVPGNSLPEGNGASGIAPAAPDACPHQSIIDLYHAKLPTARRVRTWTHARKQALRARWREEVKRQDLNWWARFFDYVAESDFLIGKTSTPGRRPFDLSLDWLVKAENMAKVIEGKYEREQEVSA